MIYSFVIGFDARTFIKEDGDREFSRHEPALQPKITKGIWAMRIYQTWTAQLKMRVKNSCSEFVNWTLCLGLCCWIPSPIHGIMLSSPGLHEPKAMLAMLVSLNLFWIQGRFLAPLKPAGSWLRDFLQMAKCLKISKRSFYGLSL